MNNEQWNIFNNLLRTIDQLNCVKLTNEHYLKYNNNAPGLCLQGYFDDAQKVLDDTQFPNSLKMMKWLFDQIGIKYKETLHRRCQLTYILDILDEEKDVTEIQIDNGVGDAICCCFHFETESGKFICHACWE